MTTKDSDLLDLEGMVSTLTVLRVLSTDIAAVRMALRGKVAQMPGFFKGAPIVLDISELESPDADGAVPLADVSLEQVVGMMRAEKLVPVGVCNLRQERRDEASALGLACLRGGRTSTKSRRPSSSVKSKGPAKVDVAKFERDTNAPVDVPTSLLIKQPIRGGQVVYAEQTDAVVLASVNSGGELIADGNIHVYGALRGRALAGAHGNEAVNIFCAKLEAELISIAGTYLRADEIPEAFRGKPAQISLEGENLLVKAL